jgi:hypothetical protein
MIKEGQDTEFHSLIAFLMMGGPPFTLMVWPVIQWLSSKARNTTVPVQSAGSSGRLMLC